MKKKTGIIVLSVIGIIILLGIIFFAIDFNRVEKQELPLFCIKGSVYRDGGTTEYIGLGYKVIDYHIASISQETNEMSYYDTKYIGTWFMDYDDHKNDKVQINTSNNGVGATEVTFKGVDIKDLPQSYPEEQAAKDGCFVISNANKIYNKEKLDSFILNTGINSKERKADKIRIVYYTVEGDSIITDVEYKMLDKTYTDENNEVVNKWTYIVSKDTTRDKWSVETDRKIITDDDIPGREFGIIEQENADNIEIKIALYAEIDYTADAPKIYKDIEICSYSKTATEGFPSFYGKVLESNQGSIVVEPYENEDERKSSDKFDISLGENNDAIYEVGTNVKITYTGYIMESYPAQLDAVKIELKSADEFELIYEKQPNGQELAMLILNKDESDKYDYNIASDGNVSIYINGEKLTLRDALLNNKITMDEIIAKANNDLKNGKILGDMYSDGGTMIYKYPNYTIKKFHTLDGNRDVYISNVVKYLN